MKQILRFVTVAMLSFFAFSCNAQSLAQITEEQVSLQNAMALAMDIKPELYTRSMFHKDIVAYAAFIGIPYYNATTNGYNNVAILHASSNGYFTRSNESPNESTMSTESTVVTLAVTMDSVGMSSFQKEHYAKAGVSFTVSNEASGVDVTPSAGSRSPEELKENLIPSFETTSGTDTATLGGATHPIISTVEGFVSTYVNRIDTVNTIDTIVDVKPEFCHCTEEVPMSELWVKYMNLRTLIRQERNAGQRALLVGCRVKLGAIVRSAKRYEVPVAKGTIGAVEYRSVPAEWCDSK